MNLLGAILYDPTTAVNKVTTAAIAMTAIDTTNLRIAFTIPAHGKVKVRLKATIHGATTFPQILMGVLEGATVRMRVAPMTGGGNLAATTIQAVEAEAIVTGLTPGAVNWDAAYGVETLVAATGLKYGGPNNTTANDAWGGFVFEIWDPIPLPTAAPGAANGVQICGANAATTYATLTSTGAFTVNGVANVSQTGDSFAVVKSAGTGDNAAIKAKTDLIPAAPASTTNITAGTITTVTTTTNLTNLPTIPANWITAAGITAAALNGKGDWNIGKTGYTLTATTGLGNQTANITGTVSGTVGGIAGTTQTLDALQTAQNTAHGAGSWATATGFATPTNITAASGVALAADQAVNATKIGGAAVTATTSVTFPAACTVATTTGAVGSVTGAVGSVVGLTASNLDATVSSRSTYAGGAVASVTGSVGSVVGLTASNLDTTVSSRLATTSYVPQGNRV